MVTESVQKEKKVTANRFLKKKKRDFNQKVLMKLQTLDKNFRSA